MKYHQCICQHKKYRSETEALQTIVGVPELFTERIEKPFHHKERVRLYSGVEVVKKYRPNNQRAIGKAYSEAKAHVNLSSIGVNVPELFGVLHTDVECSLFLKYIDSKPLTSFLISKDPCLSQHLFSTGVELGKMFEYGFLHGDLTSYHVLSNGKTYLFDLERTKQFKEEDDFYKKLAIEWTRFIDSTQGGRWNIPFSKEQEEIVFEGVRHSLSDKKTLRFLENIVLENKNLNECCCLSHNQSTA